MAVNKLLEQRNNNSSELLEQLDSRAIQLHEETNRREWRAALDRQIDEAFDNQYGYNPYSRLWETQTRREAERQWRLINELSPKNRMMQEERARQRAINEIEQELHEHNQIDNRPWWRRLLWR